MAKLPSRPQWYRDMIARLRAGRSTGGVPAAEFLGLAADEIGRHPEYARELFRADAEKYDRAVDAGQRASFGEEMAAAAAGYFEAALIPGEVLARLGLDVKLELGFGRKVDTAAATHDDRMKAIEELERRSESWRESNDRKIAAIRALDDLAGDRALREVVAEPDDRRREAHGG